MTALVDCFDVAVQPGNVRESISQNGRFAAVDEILTARETLVLVARLRHIAMSVIGTPPATTARSPEDDAVEVLPHPRRLAGDQLI
jgi:hypothetical protein